MQLTKEHRIALIHKLEKANEELRQAQCAIADASMGSDNAWEEIHHYLCKQQVATITRALIDNEIDY